MKTLALTALLVAAPLLALPATAAVTTSTVPRTFDTAFVPQTSAGDLPGVLRIAISHDGIVSGYYRPIDGDFTDVTGGVVGERIWLDLGRDGARHLVGTYDGTTIRAGALGGSCADVADCTYAFRADAVRS